MPQLAQTIISKSKFIIRKAGIYVESLLGCNSDFELMFCPCVGNDLPVVNSSEKRLIGNDSPKVVVSFIKERVSAVRWKRDFFRLVVWVPCKFSDHVRVSEPRVVFNRLVQVFLFFNVVVSTSWLRIVLALVPDSLMHVFVRLLVVALHHHRFEA